MISSQNHKLKYCLTLGIVAMEGRGFEYPSDAVIAEKGQIYVTNKSRDYGERGVRITVLDFDSHYYGTFGHYGFGEGNLISPSGITADSDGSLYVADDYTNSVTSFDLDGNFKHRWGTKGGNKGELHGPSGIASDSKGHIYISDTRNHRIQKFTTSGEFISSFGSLGAGAGELNLPWGLDVSSSGEIHVADWGNNRIQKFSSDGDFIELNNFNDDNGSHLNHPSSVAVDRDGNKYIADWGNESVKVFDASGIFLQEMRGEATLSKWANEFLETNKEEGLSRRSADLEALGSISESKDPHTISAHIEKFFWSPVSVKLQGADYLFVTESNRHRIQVYSLNSS